MKYDDPSNLTAAGSSAAEVKTTRMASVLVVDDALEVRESIRKELGRHFGLVEIVGNIESADALWQRVHFEVIVISVSVSGNSGIDWVRGLRNQGYRIPVIFISDK